MTDKLKNKIAIVTGAGSIGPGWGNGKATAVIFAREGAKVLCTDINEEAAQETANIITDEGGVASVISGDVSKSDHVQEIINRCLDEFGRIDILHNNVGIVKPGGAAEQSEDDWDRAMAVNLKSVFLTSKFCIPQMKKQKGGSIINLSSISALRYLGIDYVSYPTSKAAINQFTKVSAAQYGPWNIRVNAILPGFNRTPMVDHAVIEMLKNNSDETMTIEKYLKWREDKIPLRRWGDAWDIAKAAVFLASDDSSYITGLELVVDGGTTLVLE
ncbi:MAG: SDR family oxidoreductase [Alphaproteobacteria bacterium]|nr:SDR family oxidoreductase [Alphaproteobacteria bacterium]|tara:strand:+ start:1002 stop:1817 length:816 start_codon:yes stop_codon:yes gene_type:complete